MAAQAFPAQYPQNQPPSSLHASLVEPYTVTVVEQLRTSPLPPGVSESPIGRSDLGGPGSSGGVGHGGNTGGDKGVSSQRYQAQILSLERQNAELHKRLADVQAALEAAQQGRRALEAKNDTLQDEVAQAKSDAKARESALETARRANDAISTELRGVQEELSSARDALAGAKDTAVQWQDRAMDAAKELEAARRKIEALGEEERRLSAENMVLRKEVQQLNDAIIKGRIEGSELRDKLRQAQQEGARAASEVHMLASRAESEQESAAVQLVLMRNRVAELEARNSQMVFDLAAAREDSARARQAAEATKAALAAKPAGIISELGPASRHYGTLTQAWLGTEGTGGAPSTGAAGGGGGLRSAVADRGPGAGRDGPGPSAEAASAPASSAAAAVLRELPRDVAFSKLDPETFRSMVRAEAEALARGSAAAGSRAAASYDAGGHGSLAYDAGPPSPPPPRYGGYGASGVGASTDAPGAEASSGSVASGLQAPSSHPAWAAPQSYGDNRPSYDSRSYEPSKPYEVRDSLAAMLPDPRSSWAASLAEARGAPGYAAGGDGGAFGARPAAVTGQRPPLPPSSAANQQQLPGPTSPPPPYAIHTADSSYAYRRPPNAVGAGAAASAGAGGAGADGSTPFGTEETAKALLARSKALEDQLMVLCAEKGGLEAEYARMPLGAGRSQRERNRKAVVEQRLELLNKEISAVRMQLKRIGVK
ncbi:hypothetical protein HYH02_002734 [Chlamydomonas schloesseri]|uniref:Uncharacterized protein n=1 Tax=Chlamydomonas schloesseri TaxID=2026947 RepID=A0A836BAX4_9CHLO|nr:hypothetical protein HYH02_002734 [Chlamydomonas schloesseri]|eukprot:KAG2452495.1 hypothetical protein HYH02_002734 [Chlamydomonas schloesseri]